MNDNDKDSQDTEIILVALDQISQTIDVMTSVVGRLRTYLQEQDNETGSADGKQNQRLETSSNRILH